MLDYKNIVIFLASLSCGQRFTFITLAKIKVLAFQKYCICTLNRVFFTSGGFRYPGGKTYMETSMSHPCTSFCPKLPGLLLKETSGSDAQDSRLIGLLYPPP